LGADFTGITRTFDVTVGEPTHATDLRAAGIELYPVPTDNALTIESDTRIEQIAIFDLQGRRMMQTAPRAAQAQLALDHLPTGMYVIGVQNERGMSYGKIIKQ
ncbi:MAG: T9SS type A sorting domain-containing protein, partial [Catalinimonas sp.]